MLPVHGSSKMVVCTEQGAMLLVETRLREKQSESQSDEALALCQSERLLRMANARNVSFLNLSRW